MGFHIGQKVVCIEPHPQNVVIVGEIYVIQDKMNCPHCNVEFVDVGVNIPASGILCTSCNNGVRTGGKWFLYATRFRPLDSLEQQLERIQDEGNEILEPHPSGREPAFL